MPGMGIQNKEHIDIQTSTSEIETVELEKQQSNHINLQCPVQLPIGGDERPTSPLNKIPEDQDMPVVNSPIYRPLQELCENTILDYLNSVNDDNSIVISLQLKDTYGNHQMFRESMAKAMRSLLKSGSLNVVQAKVFRAFGFNSHLAKEDGDDTFVSYCKVCYLDNKFPDAAYIIGADFSVTGDDGFSALHYIVTNKAIDGLYMQSILEKKFGRNLICQCLVEAFKMSESPLDNTLYRKLLFYKVELNDVCDKTGRTILKKHTSDFNGDNKEAFLEILNNMLDNGGDLLYEGKDSKSPLFDLISNILESKIEKIDIPWIYPKSKLTKQVPVKREAITDTFYKVFSFYIREKKENLTQASFLMFIELEADINQVDPGTGESFLIWFLKFCGERKLEPLADVLNPSLRPNSLLKKDKLGITALYYLLINGAYSPTSEFIKIVKKITPGDLEEPFVSYCQYFLHPNIKEEASKICYFTNINIPFFGSCKPSLFEVLCQYYKKRVKMEKEDGKQTKDITSKKAYNSLLEKALKSFNDAKKSYPECLWKELMSVDCTSMKINNLMKDKVLKYGDYLYIAHQKCHSPSFDPELAAPFLFETPQCDDRYIVTLLMNKIGAASLCDALRHVPKEKSSLFNGVLSQLNTITYKLETGSISTFYSTFVATPLLFFSEANDLFEMLKINTYKCDTKFFEFGNIIDSKSMSSIFNDNFFGKSEDEIRKGFLVNLSHALKKLLAYAPSQKPFEKTGPLYQWAYDILKEVPSFSLNGDQEEDDLILKTLLSNVIPLETCKQYLSGEIPVLVPDSSIYTVMDISRLQLLGKLENEQLMIEIFYASDIYFEEEIFYLWEIAKNLPSFKKEPLRNKITVLFSKNEFLLSIFKDLKSATFKVVDKDEYLTTKLCFSKPFEKHKYELTEQIKPETLEMLINKRPPTIPVPVNNHPLPINKEQTVILIDLTEEEDVVIKREKRNNEEPLEESPNKRSKANFDVI